MLFTRRQLFRAAAPVGLLLATGGPALAWHSTEMRGALPRLDFTMTRAADGKTVTAVDFRGKIVVLYFGYTFCPDVCPTTLLNMTTMLKALGPRADDVRVLFVTVDPHRDTLDVLKQYVGSFAPQAVGLRGTPDQLAALAKRYRVAFSVTPVGDSFAVTHGTAVYVFDRNGDSTLLFTGLAEPNTKLDDMTADLRQLVTQGSQVTWWQRVWQML